MEKIKSTIKKLLAMSSSDNLNEAEIAIKKCNELLSKYNLTKADIFTSSQYIKTTKLYCHWRWILADSVADLYCTRVIRSTDSQGKSYYEFYGEELDVFMSTEMYTYLEKSVQRIARNKIKKNAKRNYRISFKTGLANSIALFICNNPQTSWYCRVNGIKESEDRERKLKLIDEYLEKNFNLTETKKRNEKLNKIAFNRGSLYVDEISFSRQMSSNEEFFLE